MAKSRKTLSARIPPYVHPRNRWRRQIHQAISKELAERGVIYSSADRLEVNVRLYMRSEECKRHDLDNRLKDIMDALQGRMGGSKKYRPHLPLIPNDHQIWRIIAEKSTPPRQSHGLSHLKIKIFRRR